MYYGATREEQDKIARERIEFYRECAALFPQVKKVIESFNGKVYNVRFEKALQEATGLKGLHAEKRNGVLAIYYYRDYRRNGDLLRVLLKKALPDGKRIDAAALVENLRETRADRLKDATEIENNLSRVDETREQVEELKKTLESIMESLPWAIRDIYRLNARVECR